MTVRLLVRLKIDDPVDCIPVHLTCAVFGLICVGLFATENENSGFESGLFYSGSFHLLGVQLVGIVAIMGWGIANAMFMHVVLSFVMTSARVPAAAELLGSGFSSE
jgi:Amt family ammonium transporter